MVARGAAVEEVVEPGYADSDRERARRSSPWLLAARREARIDPAIAASTAIGKPAGEVVPGGRAGRGLEEVVVDEVEADDADRDRRTVAVSRRRVLAYPRVRLQRMLQCVGRWVLMTGLGW